MTVCGANIGDHFLVVAHSVAFDETELVEESQEVVLPTTDVEWAVVVLFITYWHIKFAIVDDELLIVLKTFIEEYFEQTNSLDLIARYRVEDEHLVSI